MFSFLSSIGLTTAAGPSDPLPELNQDSDLKEVLEGLDALLNDDLDGIYGYLIIRNI